MSNQEKWQISRCDECECAWWVTAIGEERFCADCLKEALLGGEEYLDKFSNGRWDQVAKEEVKK